MSIVNKSVAVEQAPLDLLDQVAKILTVVKAQPAPLSAAAIPAEVGALIAGLQPILADCQGLGGAYQENKLAFYKALMLGGDDVVEAALGVAPAVPAASS